MMKESTDTLESLIEKLFLFSKLDLRKVPFHIEPVRMTDFLTAYQGERSLLIEEQDGSMTLSADVGEIERDTVSID